MNIRLKALTGLLIVAGTISVARAADLTLKVAEMDPPEELGESIRAALQHEAIRLLDGEKAVFEFWFRKDLPLQSKPSSPSAGLDSLKETTLVGAARISRKERDYQDGEILPGVYTMRFALQPQNGNHLGTSDYPYFLALVPAKLDPAIDSISDFDTLVKASAKQTAEGHPMVLSLRPVSNGEGEFPSLNEPAPDHKSVRMKLSARDPGGEKAELYFELVYEGKGYI